MRPVCVIDDDEGVARSLRALLSSVGIEATRYASPEAFLTSANPADFGCLVLDVRMPGMSGIDLYELLRSRGLNIPAVFITGHGDVRTAVRAVKAGAIDFIEKPFRDQELLDCVQKALARDVERRAGTDDSAVTEERVKTLTAREKEVLDLVVAGQSSKVIARQLHISPKTVEFHRARVMEKMHARSVLDLVRLLLTARPSTPS
ncbi:LuxR family two component transcriptional regulator [Panacagrimonas perspica]|uniref:LuxR family two component transcriptional regulator n=1 Tax=Panacagrimonas perspica TaxID=381431 RepID=A0A4S3K2F8_9GAMM|nr:response regulator [Panacagrimonas perspica]TDU26494.1 LuxR family two component transcriptional regulator [Panacagrimonas perspica]THD02108.1 hypothetical protein B1810_16670 [Panacagrimonas perspica]